MIGISFTLLLFTFLVPMMLTVMTTGPLTPRMVFWPIFIPFQVLMVRHFAFMWRKDVMTYHEAMETVLSTLEVVLKQQGFTVSMSRPRRWFPKFSLYHAVVVVNVDVTDIHLYLKQVRIVGTEEIILTHVFIGPTSGSMIGYIIMIQNIIDSAMEALDGAAGSSGMVTR